MSERVKDRNLDFCRQNLKTFCTTHNICGLWCFDLLVARKKKPPKKICAKGNFDFDYILLSYFFFSELFSSGRWMLIIAKKQNVSVYVIYESPQVAMPVCYICRKVETMIKETKKTFEFKIQKISNVGWVKKSEDEDVKSKISNLMDIGNCVIDEGDKNVSLDFIWISMH